MSSDSDDDCYGNIALKLQSIKSKYKEVEKNKIPDNSLNYDCTKKNDNNVITIDNNSDEKCSEVYQEESDIEEISLDTIIEQNSKKRQTRNLKKNADISTENIIYGKRTKRSRVSKKPDNSETSSCLLDTDISNPGISNKKVSTTRGRGAKRGRKSRGTSNTSNINTSLSRQLSESSESSSNLRRSHRRSQTPQHNRNTHISMSNRPLPSQLHQPAYPTYNVGDAEDYPDECYDQPLFTLQNNDAVIVMEKNEPLNDSLDENEELSVKVYWQNCDVVKFTIRRFQKFTQIFDFFAKRENVSHDKLFFTYNDKILKSDDTPDTITYSIAKFIDGGIVSKSVSNIVSKKNSTRKSGINIKFQCQNIKKPFEISVQPNEKLSFAMMMCAENLEKPLDKLKFHFDGDTISGKNTAKELELEGGECIDVTIHS